MNIDRVEVQLLPAMLQICVLVIAMSMTAAGDEAKAESAVVASIRAGIETGSHTSIEAAAAAIDAHVEDLGAQLATDLLCAAAAKAQDGLADTAYVDRFVSGLFGRPSFNALPRENQLTCVRAVLANERLATRAGDGPDRTTFRAKLVPALLRWAGRIEQTIDPAFDLTVLPQMSVAPPEQTGLPPGTDPVEIADPALRARYQADLATADVYAQRFAEQLELSRLFAQVKAQIAEYIAACAFDANATQILQRCAQQDAKLSPVTIAEIFPATPK